MEKRERERGERERGRESTEGQVTESMEDNKGIEMRGGKNETTNDENAQIYEKETKGFG